MSFNQPNIFGEDQPDMFGAAAKQPTHQVNPQHIRNRFIKFLAAMQNAETWPWDVGHVETLRDLTWPYLFAKMPDQIKGAEWKAKIEAEAATLDLAQAETAQVKAPSPITIRHSLPHGARVEAESPLTRSHLTPT